MSPAAHTIETRPLTQTIRVELDGEVIAESTDALLLDETRVRPRWYLPLEDVRADVLRSSDHQTFCPWKGTASYYHVETAAGIHRDVVWYYPEPHAEVGEIRGRVAFYDERVELFVDGEPNG